VTNTSMHDDGTLRSVKTTDYERVENGAPEATPPPSGSSVTSEPIAYSVTVSTETPIRLRLDTQRIAEQEAMRQANQLLRGALGEE
jgi:hypothetical protein